MPLKWYSAMRDGEARNNDSTPSSPNYGSDFQLDHVYGSKDNYW